LRRKKDSLRGDETSSRIAIGLENKGPLGAVVEAARAAEASGFESVWVAENLYYRDALATVAYLARSTGRIGLATGAINCFSRHPVQVALAAATLSTLSGGRFILGVGTGTERRVSEQMGMSFEGQYRTLREFIAIVRTALSGAGVEHEGSKFRVSGVRLAEPPGGGVPIYIATVGSTAASLAGEIADGVLLDYAGSEEYVRKVVADLKSRPAPRRRRTTPDVAALVICSISEDRREAVEEARRHLLPILSAPKLGEALLERSGEDPLVSARLRRLQSPHGDFLSSASGLLDDGLVRRLSIAGNRDDLVSRIEDYRSAGVDLPVLVPVPEARAADLIAAVSPRIG
jgi:5,10-methylenetetrahydromethanopterin reductase